MRQELGVSERRACRTLGQHRSTQRQVPQGRADEERLTDDIIELADHYGRYGYRMVTGLLNNAGWQVNHKRVERIWRREGLKVPQKQKKKGRLWLNDGRACVSGQSGQTTSGLTTSSKTAPLTGGSIARSISLMNTQGRR